MFAEGGDEFGGKRDTGAVFQQEREAFAELDDEAGVDLPREINLDEADIGAHGPPDWSVVRF